MSGAMQSGDIAIGRIATIGLVLNEKSKVKV